MTGRTQKQEVESAFHDAWARETDVSQLMVDEAFTAPTAVENRCILDFFGSLKGKKLLDLGCGSGEAAVYFAGQGAKVTAVDISPGQLDVARLLANRFGVNIRFLTMAAEDIADLDTTFDLIYGNGVLHHVDLKSAAKAISEVSGPLTKAAFIEPLAHNPAIHLYRILAKQVRTPTEKPLSIGDYKVFNGLFEKIEHREFWLVANGVFVRFLLEGMHPSRVRYWKQVIKDAHRIAGFHGLLERFDRRLLANMPWLGRYCWNMVILLTSGL